MATRGVGRPRLNRDLQSYIPRIEPDLADALQVNAQMAGLSLGGYLTHVLSEAHGYRGRFLQELPAPLPMALAPELLRERTAALTIDDCTPVIGKGVPTHVRVDRPVADRIQARVDHLGCASYSAYVRAIFRVAAGHDQRTRGVQTFLSDELMGGVQRRRSA